MKPSLSFIGSGIFLLFILRSIYSLYSIFDKPVCKPGDVCYKSSLNSKPNLDLHVFLSDNSKSGNNQLILDIPKFDYTNYFEKEITVELSKTARNNGTLFIVTIITPSRTLFKDEKELGEIMKLPNAVYVKNRLTKYAIPFDESYNLLKDTIEMNKFQNVIKPITHIRSKYTIMMCTDELNIPRNEVPMELVNYMRLNKKNELLPMIEQDILQTKIKDLRKIHPEMKTVNFTYIYKPVSIGKMKFIVQLQATMSQFLELGFTEKDLDEVKSVFADTNLYLLCATMAIGSIHLLLDFLTFKNDISFWKSQKSMAGLSTRSVLWRAFSQTVIFMFLIDEGTSLIVLIPCGIASLIEFWKVGKVLKPSFSFSGGIKFDKDKTETDEEMQTRKYDEECMKYLSYVLYPLCVGSAIYSLLYQPHKSWYSWTVNSLVNGVYAFGFLFMLPQLFINYRLKSVAALPWRAFTYKAFNTFIDDLFAFIITMPTAHRVACFRDDIIFLIYLYQRWLYPVDKSRTDDILPGEVIDAVPDTKDKLSHNKEEKKTK